MAEQTSEEKAKKFAGEAKTSVKSYKEGTETEKQKMSKSVHSLLNDIKKQRAVLREALKTMKGKINAFGMKINTFGMDLSKSKKELRANVKLFQSDINKTKSDFRSYSKAFWG